MATIQSPLKHSAYVRASRHKCRALKLGSQVNDLTADEIEFLLLNSSYCAICHEPLTDFHDKALDHIIPMSKGGANSLMNVQIICHRCNSKKNTRTYTKFTNGQFLLFVASGFAPPEPKIITEKKCPGCKQTKPLSDFYKNVHTKLGITSRCKECLKIVNAVDRALHPERQQEYYQRLMADPEKRRQWNERQCKRRRKHYQEDPEYWKKLYWRNVEGNRARAKKHREKHKEEYKNYQKEYYRTHPEYFQEYYLENAARLQKYSREYGRKWREAYPDYMKIYYLTRKTGLTIFLADA